MAAPSRIVESLRARSFGTVVAELLLITVGILLALAVDGWIQDRDERRLERESLELLRADLVLLQSQLDEFVSYQESLERSAGTAYRALTEYDRVPRQDSIRMAFADLLGRRTLRLPRAAYEELVGTGNLRLIQDPVLRQAVVRFYATVAREEAIIGRNNTTFVDDLVVPFLVGEGLVHVPRDGRPSGPMQTIVGDFRERMRAVLGPEEDPFPGRLWGMRRGEFDHDRAIALILMALRTASGSVLLAERMQEGAGTLMGEIDARLTGG